MRFKALLEETLAELEAGGLLRVPDDGSTRRQVEAAARRCGVRPIDASSNDYLGLAGSVVSRETLAAPGAAASRLIHGTTAEHVRLESELAGWVRTESALLFASTYAANCGLVSALGVRDSLVVSDAANHASLIDGARLSRAEVRVVPHLDLGAIRLALADRRASRACFVVTESYFSMDGDGPDLASLRALCDAYDACLIVDEAHALGVFGPAGAGRCVEAAVVPDVLVGALGKAVGTHGGFIAGSEPLRTFLWNKARSFVFSTAPSPRHAALTSLQLERVIAADSARVQLSAHANLLRNRLAAAGLALAAGSFGPIVSLVLGSNERAFEAAARLRERGILAQAIRPPTVPVGAARLRLTVKSTFTPEELQRLTNEVIESCHAS